MDGALRLPNSARVRRVVVKVLACSTLLALPACQIPGLRDADPPPALPAAFPPLPGGAPSPENSAQLGVDEFFQDPVLTRLISQALAANRELKVLGEEVEVARNEILARRGAYLPSAEVRAGAGLEKPSRYTRNGAIEEQLEILPGKPFPSPLGDFAGAINFILPLDIWRALRNARDAAEQRYLAAVERQNFVATRVIAEVAEDYYRLMALDQRIENLNSTIKLQEQSLDAAKAKMAAGRGTELAVQRFQAEVRKNQGERLNIQQEIVEVENRINFRLNRYPVPVERSAAGFLDLTVHPLGVGVPAQLLQNRPDIRQAEREVAAAGLDVAVARAQFFPSVTLTAGIGYQAFNPKYLLNPEALAYNAAGDLAAPLINQAAIRAEYMSANARQLQSIYNYQRVVLNAVTEVINRVSAVENYGKGLDYRRQQLQALEASVDAATKLFQNARVEYIEVLFAQRDLLEARMVMIETKWQQLSAIVNAYQALGGGGRMLQGLNTCPGPGPVAVPLPPLGPLPVPLPQPVPAGPKQPAPLPQPQPVPAGPNPPAAQPAALAPIPQDGVEYLPATRIGLPAGGK